jgi:hypothetical protein
MCLILAGELTLAIAKHLFITIDCIDILKRAKLIADSIYVN